MKKTNLLLCLPVFVLAGVLATLNFGCGKKNTPSGGTSGGGLNASPAVSVEKTSFTEVTSQLDPGGNFYLYLGTAQWLDGLDAKVGAWRQTFTAMPGITSANLANINKAFDIATRLIKDSGIEDVSGVGMSSVEIEKGMFRNKALLHHYAGKGDGFLWKLAGGEPHPLTGLDFLPEDTALAVFTDADLPLLWTVAQKEIGKSDLPQAQAWLQKLPAQFERQTQVKWDAFLNSLGGEFGLVITLDPSSNIPVPLPSGSLTVPTPGLLLVVKVNDDTIFNRIDKQLKSNRQVISVDKPGLKMRTMPVPIPFISQLRPSAASSGGYLFIASSDELIDDALAVKSGQQPGLKATAEFKHMAQACPTTATSSVTSARDSPNLDEGAATGHDQQRQDPAGDGEMDAILLPQPARLCLLRRHQHAGRLPDRRQQQPKLCHRRAATRRGRVRHAGRNCHPQLCESPRNLAAKRLHQQSPAD